MCQSDHLIRNQGPSHVFRLNQNQTSLSDQGIGYVNNCISNLIILYQIYVLNIRQYFFLGNPLGRGRPISSDWALNSYTTFSFSFSFSKVFSPGFLVLVSHNYFRFSIHFLDRGGTLLCQFREQRKIVNERTYRDRNVILPRKWDK